MASSSGSTSSSSSLDENPAGELVGDLPYGESSDGSDVEDEGE